MVISRGFRDLIITMPYKRSRKRFGAKRKNVRRRTAYRAKTRFRRSAGRTKMVRSIQVANLKPSTKYLRFQGDLAYQLQPIMSPPLANYKSILNVPMNFLGDPFATASAGVWNPEPGQFIPSASVNTWFAQYKDYRIHRSSVSVTVKPLQTDGAFQNFQTNALVSLLRTQDATILSATTANRQLRNDYGANQSQWGVATSGFGYRQGYNRIGYTPKRQFNLKDIKDSTQIICDNTYGDTPSEPVYAQVIIHGGLDVLDKPHGWAMVVVKADYIVEFINPTVANIPA